MVKRRSLGIPLWVGLVAILLPALAAAQPASLLTDLNTTPDDDYDPLQGFFDLREAGGKLYFRGAGQELWVSDGTSTGTQILRDLCLLGPCYSGGRFLGELGKLMIFLSGGELWRSDGTRPGTFVLTEPGIGVETASEPHVLHAFYRRFFYFVGCAGPNCDLWRTDGTAAGTQIFHGGPQSFSWLYAAGTKLYYLEKDNQGADLWVTDGTQAGTVRLHRFEGPYFSHPRVPTSAGGRLFFIAGDGEEVWTSDGSPAGTRPVTDFASARPFGYRDWLKPSGSQVYFVADDGVHGQELWRADGTASGSARVTDLEEDDPFPDDEPTFLAQAGGLVIFQTTDGDSRSTLWTTRGTLRSTAPLALPCGSCDDFHYGPLIESSGKVFFLATTDDRRELWATDGTATGTRKARDLCSSYSCEMGHLRPWQGGVLFSIKGNDNDQIWFSDGTPAGTKPFTRLVGASLPYDEYFEVVAVGGDTFFVADGEDFGGLWVRDAAGKTRPVFTFRAPAPGSEPRRLMAFNNGLLFTAWGDGGGGPTFSPPELWSSAGTPETTVRLHQPTLYSSEEYSELVQAAGLVFFQVGEGYWPSDLWRTDGTPQGTFVVAHLQEDSAAMVPYQGSLYFFDSGWIWKTNGTVAGTVKTGEFPPELEGVGIAVPGPNGIYLKGATPSGTEFWFTDGTTAGTHQFTNFEGDGFTGADPEFTTVGSHVYFSWDGLWRTDGTPAGTTQIPLEDLPPYGFATKLFAYQGALYFFTAGQSSEHGLQLRRADGTSSVVLARFPGQDTYYFPVKLTPFGGKLYFNVDDGVHGIELWATDGTPAGTGLVRDLYPGKRSSAPTQLTVAGDRFFFTAGDDLHGIELWQSDGTAEGTRLVQDIAPQAASSSPEQLTVAGNNLYFTADDGITGREVWVLPLAGSGACRPSSTRLCLSGGRYAVEAVWRDFEGHQGVGQAVSLTADTGYFWFFNPANVETVLKVLDGRGVNGHVWVFYGALSNVEYMLTVTDTQTGLARRYLNPSGQLASVADTNAFGPLGASTKAVVVTSVSSPSPLPIVERRAVAAKAGACAPSSTRLCLRDGRFAVEIAWKDFNGKTGVGQAVELTSDTGWFWFFNQENVEVVLKVLDGRPVNNKHWVFYGALSNVEYTVTVTDTQTGKINTYKNARGQLASVADLGAF
ncbi:MAG TPA: ELWxxDGT repeat protein [Thermoanaerobaculia bacterium]|nr:ELWxxDGT repeat protein [Thermoanaerobaculia bacterium]